MTDFGQYQVMICGQGIILPNGELAEALSSLPEKKEKSLAGAELQRMTITAPPIWKGNY